MSALLGRVALVDDDRNILASVSMALESFHASLPDIVVLDIKMPRLDGFELLQRLREFSSVPVIFLTSKDGEEDELIGLKLGADDYIKKPFSQRLLIERIRALLRREQLAQGANISGAVGLSADASPVPPQDLVLDTERHLCLWRGAPVGLTITEFLLLNALVQEPGHVRTREYLLKVAYGENDHGYHPDTDDRTIDSHIKRMRRKFRDVDPEFDSIETLYGAGYRYRLPVSSGRSR
jgi:two-component system response regulator ChvI